MYARVDCEGKVKLKSLEVIRIQGKMNMKGLRAGEVKGSFHDRPRYLNLPLPILWRVAHAARTLLNGRFPEAISTPDIKAQAAATCRGSWYSRK